MDLTIDEFLKRQDCLKHIKRSKYERNDPEVLVWWNKLFDELESKCKQPDFKKRPVLRRTYSPKTIDDLENIGLEIHSQFEGDFLRKCRSEILDHRRQKELDKQGVWDAVKIQQQKEKTDPYMNFMRKTENEARIWRPKKKNKLEVLSLTEKAENVTETIAGNFDEWFTSMGGTRKSEIDKDTILDLFRINFDYPASTSINRTQKELKSLPAKVAEAIGKPEFSHSKQIKEQIMNDVANTKKAHPSVAFGKTLPLTIRSKPTTEDVETKWLKCYVYHDELTSMETCFKDIVELQSCRSFCKWLTKHPNIPQAPYLKDRGYLEPRALQRRMFSAYQIIKDDIEWEHMPRSSTYHSLRRPSKIVLPDRIFSIPDAMKRPSDPFSDLPVKMTSLKSPSDPFNDLPVKMK